MAGSGLMMLALIVAGCGARESPPQPAAPGAPTAAAAPVPARARAAAIRAAAGAAPTVAGKRDAPGTSAAWRGFFAGDELRLLEESVTGPPGPPLENRYYFEHGALFYYSGEQPAAAASGAAGAAPRAPVVAEFRGAQVLSAVRIEHYGEVRLEPAEVAAIQHRAAELAAAARNEQSARKVAP